VIATLKQQNITRLSVAATHHGLYAAGVFLLTGATGSLDAVSFLSLDQVFTGNMTGNILFLGFGLAGVDGIPVVNNAVALMMFVVGAGLAAVVTRGGADTRTLPLSSVVILSVNAVVTSAVTAAWYALGGMTGVLAIAVTGVLALVLGAQAAAVARIGIREYSTVVVTMTLVSLASESRLFGGTGAAQSRRVLVLAAMTAGAAAAAALLTTSGAAVALTLGAAQMAAGCAAVILARRLEAMRHIANVRALTRC
jgi:uncharacterized membrane protein YoaK (UPF0700 family)